MKAQQNTLTAGDLGAEHIGRIVQVEVAPGAQVIDKITALQHYTDTLTGEPTTRIALAKLERLTILGSMPYLVPSSTPVTLHEGRPDAPELSESELSEVVRFGIHDEELGE